MALVVVLIAGTVQGAVGLGFTLVATPLCALLLPAPNVVGTVARTALVVDLALVVLDGRALDMAGVRRYGPAAMLAIGPGIIAVATVSDELLLLLAAAVSVIGGALLVSVRVERGAHAMAWSSGAGALAGFLGVTTGLSGPPLAVHSAWSGRPARSHRATLALLFLVIDAFAVAAHRQGVSWQASSGLVMAALVGLAIGRRIGDAAPMPFGRRAVGAVAVASGVMAFASIA